MTELKVLSFFLNSAFVFDRILDKGQKRRIVRSLRILYFYDDAILEHLRNLARSEEVPSSSVEAIRNQIYKDSIEIDNEIAFLTSPAVVTNLEIPHEVVVAIQDAANFKKGIRGNFIAIMLEGVMEGPARMVENSKAAVKEIENLNSSLTKTIARLEKGLAK